MHEDDKQQLLRGVPHMYGDAYRIINRYACIRYGLHPEDIIHPFAVETDEMGQPLSTLALNYFLSLDYPKGYVVFGRPTTPFEDELIDHYLENDMKFFLALPYEHGQWLKYAYENSLALIVCGAFIPYGHGTGDDVKNAGECPTMFLTNLEPAGIRSEPKLFDTLDFLHRIPTMRPDRIMDDPRRPREVFVTSLARELSAAGIEFDVPFDKAALVDRLDCYGSVQPLPRQRLILSGDKADELEEKMTAAGWSRRDGIAPYVLSERERAISDAL